MKNFDLLSGKVELNFNSMKGHNSFIGGVISIFIYAGIIGLSVYFTLDLIYRDNPRAFLVNKFVNDAREFELGNDGMPHAFGLMDVRTRKYTEFDSRTLKLSGANRKGRWDYDACNWEVDIKGTSLEHFLQKEDVPKLFCVRKHTNLITGKVTTKTSADTNMTFPYMSKGMSTSDVNSLEYYEMKGVECQNTTEVNNCYPREVIHEKLMLHVSAFLYSNKNFDISNYTNPIVENLSSIANLISFDSRVDNHINFAPVSIVTHDGFIFDSKNILESHKFLYNEKITTNKSKEDTLILSYAFYLQNFEDVYDRSYTRVQEVLANIGGAVKALILAGTFINFLFEKIQIMRDFTTYLSKRKIINKTDDVLKPNYSELNRLQFEEIKISHKNTSKQILHTEKGVAIKTKNIHHFNSNNSKNQIFKTSTYIYKLICCQKNEFYDQCLKLRNSLFDETHYFDLHLNMYLLRKKFQNDQDKKILMTEDVGMNDLLNYMKRW